MTNFITGTKEILNGVWQMVHSPQELSITNWQEFHNVSMEILPAAVPGNFDFYRESYTLSKVRGQRLFRTLLLERATFR